MLHSYFVEYRTFKTHCKTIVCFVDIITPQNIETFKNVIIKNHNDKYSTETIKEVDIINIAYLGGK